jgi:predicted phage tail protein
VGSKVFAAFTAVVGGVIIADIWIHPKGTAAAGTALSQILRPTYNALLGRGV